jgi:hypothetical protein
MACGSVNNQAGVCGHCASSCKLRACQQHACTGTGHCPPACAHKTCQCQPISGTMKVCVVLLHQCIVPILYKLHNPYGRHCKFCCIRCNRLQALSCARHACNTIACSFREQSKRGKSTCTLQCKLLTSDDIHTQLVSVGNQLPLRDLSKYMTGCSHQGPKYHRA